MARSIDILSNLVQLEHTLGQQDQSMLGNKQVEGDFKLSIYPYALVIMPSMIILILDASINTPRLVYGPPVGVSDPKARLIYKYKNRVEVIRALIAVVTGTSFVGYSLGY